MVDLAASHSALDSGGRIIHRRDLVEHDGIEKRVTAVGRVKVTVAAGGQIDAVTGTDCRIIERGGSL